jgi:rSAM/selenodomain-associated transferase 2
MPVRVSIVVPVLNEAAGIVRCLKALAPLRAGGTEVIVADGGSHDDTRSLALPWADRVIQAPTGRALQMNEGARASHGQVLLFLHADTRLPPDAPRRVVEALREGRRNWGRFDVRIEGRSRWLPVVATLMNLRSRLTGIATGDQAIFMRRKAFDAVGGFPEQPLMEDIEICKRLKRLSGGERSAGPACLRDKVVTSGRRWDQRGAWRTIVLMWRLRWLYWRGASAERIATLYR